MVIGELVQESWSKDGKIYYKHKIKVKEIDFRTPKDNISEANFENEEGKQLEHKFYKIR
ncbi:hypothetical protein [Campylobacter fetus]|uniref:hypothetical protein n=1 Tax=Campylobacter fetus TaxID=196 RepID=UPI000A5D799B|nr:hypothetical protein [Campylobacter fetus]